MDSVNKIISFILGLIVVVVFIAIVTGRFKIGPNLKKNVKVSPTVTTKVTTAPTQKSPVTYNTTPSQNSGSYKSTTNPSVVTPNVVAPKAVNQYNAVNYQTTSPQIASNNISTIPNTGAPTYLLPVAFSMLLGGTFLKKLSRRK